MRLDELKLFRECRVAARPDQTTVAEAEMLASLVRKVAVQIEPLLELIARTFQQYTSHNIGHSLNVIELMGRITPRTTIKRLNALELALVMLAALLHDSGMYLEDSEKQSLLDSQEFKNYLNKSAQRVAAAEQAHREGKTVVAALIEDALLAEFVRRRHPNRVRRVIEKHFAGDLVFRDVELGGLLGDLCESHAWPVRASDAEITGRCVAALPVHRLVGSVPVNVQYLASLLRLADIMDFDRSRTPLAVFQDALFTEQKSWEEWSKHLQVTGWDIAEDRVRFQIECTRPAFYVAVHEFLDWIDAELSDCHYLIDEAPKTVPDYYALRLPVSVDRRAVVMEDKSYIAGAFHFTLDYQQIMTLLMDKSLYPDENLFLRELLQNSLDACRLADARAKAAGDTRYEPRIVVWDHSTDAKSPHVVFQDNGIGMSRRIVEDFFMRVGRSYYRSIEFEAEQRELQHKGIELEASSRFGIGILSCFLVADRFDVLTYRHGDKPLEIAIEGPTKYFSIKQLPEPAPVQFQSLPENEEADGPLGDRPGTRITVRIRSGVELQVMETLREFAVNGDYDIRVYEHHSAVPTIIKKLGWELTGAEANAETLHTANGQFAVEDLCSIVVPSRIPFESWDFSKHIRGAAWFWLFRGNDDKPCVRKGFLSLYFHSIAVVGAPGVLQALRQHYKGSRITLDRPTLEARCDDPGYRFHYGSLLPSEREAVISVFLEQQHLPDIPDALIADKSIRGVLGKLLEGNLDVLRERVNFRISSPAPLFPSFSIALHGIRIPDGVRPEPVGKAKHYFRPLGVSGYARLDARGTQAPSPVVNRLFVEVAQAAPLGHAVRRASVLYAISVIGENVTDADWRKWLHTSLSAVPFHSRADPFPEGVALLTEKFPLAYRRGSETLMLYRADVLRQFGPVVPLVPFSWDLNVPGEGLDYNDSLTGTICRFFVVNLEQKTVDLTQLL
jgi:hypothetical protein